MSYQYAWRLLSVRTFERLDSLPHFLVYTYRIKEASELSELPKRLFRFAGLNSLFILCLHSWVHTFQLDRIFWESLPPIVNVHFVLGLGVVPVAECLLLVVSVYLLNRVTWVNDLFHGK